MEYSTRALGAAIRRHRRELQLSQQQLGTDAGYGEGAGVSISRIESGKTRPNDTSLERIAAALQTSVDALGHEAARLDAEGALGHEGADADDKPLKERIEELQRTVEERTTAITTLSDAFNVAHDKARDEFFLKLVATANEIREYSEKRGETPPMPPEPQGLTDDEAGDAAASAEYRLGISSNGVAMALGGLGGATAGAAVGGAAAYTAFTAAAAFGTVASTGTAIGTLSGAAATSATFAWFGGGSLAAGGAGVAGGTMVLAGIVAAPAAILTVGGLIWMARRNKQKEAEMLVKVIEAEEGIAATQPGFDALCSALSAATGVLDDIAVHGGRAFKRWIESLGDLPVLWSTIENLGKQDQYLDFVTIAACQLTAANINPGAFIALRDDELAKLVESTSEDLDHAKATVDALV